MKHTRRIAVATVATFGAVTIGSLVAINPAAADEGALPRPSTAVAYEPLSHVLAGGTGEVVAQASSGYTGGVTKGDDGTWIAYIEPPGGFVQLEVGRYETKREARKAAKKAAEEANKGFKADPACNEPFVFC